MSANSAPDRPDTSGSDIRPLMWIDATRPSSGLVVWGMTPVERLIREAALRDLPGTRVWASAESAAGASASRADLRRIYPESAAYEQVDADGEAMFEALGRTPGPVLLVEGDVVYDDRVLDYLLTTGADSAVGTAGGAAAAHLSVAGARLLAAVRRNCAPGEGTDLASLIARVQGPQLAGSAQLASDYLCVLRPEELPEYVPSLRLTLSAFALRLGDRDEVRAVENAMYRRTFKGVIDAIAKYGYYHLVRWITRHLARTSLSPNALTLLSIIGIWAAVPLFAWGLPGAGAIAAWMGVLLDSVDGKLARLTLHLSDTMGVVEHVTAAVGLFLWFAALGWHLTGGALTDGGVLAVATSTLLGAYVVDKMVSGLFRRQLGRELFDYRPVDAAFHLIAARRNIHLVILTFGVLVDRVEAAFVGMAASMVVTLLFHFVRAAFVVASQKMNAM